MVVFEAVVRIRDHYGFETVPDEFIRTTLTKNLEEGADVEVLEIIEIKQLKEN